MERNEFLKKLDHFWYYYKFHVIGGVVAVILLFSLIKDIVNQEKPDIAIANIGVRVMQEESMANFKKKMDQIIIDADNNGKKHTQILPILYYDKMDPQQLQATSQKIQLTLIGGEAQLFIVDKSTFKDIANLGAFQPLDELAAKYGINANQNPDIKLKPKEGNEEHIYGLPLSDNELLKEIGYDSKEVFAAIKVVNNDEQKKKNTQALYKNAFSILEEMIKHNKKAG